ncbi:Cytochrome P450 4B1 [Lachnellula cervina]|uniref:Cytochrome P450 4B1 n=1 Tax=Lachnellula cervina TaxID=1316786 RepID=A0A7D8UTD7_9HELO|nr:Cytochrome P450 4B1 [Lachnellula cervina]
MLPAYAIALIGLGVWLVYSNISGLIKNIAAAKRSGLPWTVVPVDVHGMAWLLTHNLLLPWLNRLPKAWTESWLDWTTPDWPWKLLYDGVKPKGDLFLTVSPGTIQAWVTNAEAIHQITARREAFPKHIEKYKVLDIFGRNILSTEGNEWKQHRKITSPGFNEKNNGLIFAETARQTQGMLRKWMGADGTGNTTLKEVPTDTERLTLHIISDVGFGVRLLWPGEEPTEKDKGIYSGDVLPKGHSMGFEKAMSTLLQRITWILIVPDWLLKRIPMHSAREAYESFINWRQYMHELFDQKVKETQEGLKTEGMDILGSLVKSAYGDSSRAKGERPVLSDSDILGNAFVMIVAGHETTANNIHFSLMELAMSPKSQRMVQKEVHTIFGEEPPEKWDYDSSINSLLGSIIGAVMNEQLRLMAPITALPKCVLKEQDQMLIVDGKKITLPAGTLIHLNIVGVQRNPRYWPTQPSKISDRADDLNDFKPERWLVKAVGEHVASGPVDNEEDDEFGGFTGQDSHAKLFRPQKGSYLPFSEGPRSCLGRRLAQVKVMASLAVIFQLYSIELAVDEWATDDEVSKMSDEGKCVLYKKAQDAARKKMREATSLITLKLHPGFIPVRVVKKGEERFIHLIDN